MFEGLDDIDWASFGIHIAIGLDSSEIPQLVHEMLSDDKDIRTEAIASLLGEGQHLGMLAPATPFIIPFVLELLALEEYPDKDYLLMGFHYMAKELVRGGGITKMRLCIKVYDELEKGLSLYLKLLNDKNKFVRSESVQVLKYMQEQAELVLPELKLRFEQEDEVQVRVDIIESIFQLLRGMRLRYEPEGQQYKDLFTSVAENSDEAKEREAATKALQIFGSRK